MNFREAIFIGLRLPFGELPTFEIGLHLIA